MRPSPTRNTSKLEARLAAVRELRTTMPDDRLLSSTRDALADRSNLIVAEAAHLVAERRLVPLIPETMAAFDRLFTNPVKTDAKCWGKTALIKALTRLEHGESAPFVRGARHVQLEPVWGGQEDAAGELRAASLLGLVQCTDISRADVCRQLVDALADPADVVRDSAVRVLAALSGDEAALLLRLKARLGDARPAILGHVFDAILAVEEAAGVPFVSIYLDHGDPEVRDEAAFALAGCRVPAAIERLMEAWRQAPLQGTRTALVRALGSSRQPSAFACAMEVIQEGTREDAAAMRDTLLGQDLSPEMRARIQQAMDERR
jgi:hypothetical protein